VAYHSQTNAAAERTNWTIVTNIRANLGELPKSLWGLAMSYIFSVHEKQIATCDTRKQVPNRNCEKGNRYGSRKREVSTFRAKGVLSTYQPAVKESWPIGLLRQYLGIYQPQRNLPSDDRKQTGHYSKTTASTY